MIVLSAVLMWAGTMLAQQGSIGIEVSFPSNGKMEWTYDWKGEHFRGGVSHQDHRTVIAKFTKQ